MKYKKYFLFILFISQTASAQLYCTNLFQEKIHLKRAFSNFPEYWSLPPTGSKAYNHYVEKLPQAMQKEFFDIGYWNSKRTSEVRLPVVVAKLSEDVVTNLSQPRLHVPLPSFKKNGEIFYPDHIQTRADGAPAPSQNFFVRMMVIKNKGDKRIYIPEQIEYLRPFIDQALQLEKQRDPKNFHHRYAYIQVDASWVKAQHNQPRPGKTTSQNADPKTRQGAHVDGFLKENFWSMQEDITYSMSLGLKDHIPTEFFNISFPIPAGIAHAQARQIYDNIANTHPESVILLPPGTINRMSSRVVHRVGVAKEDTYRTFVKIKFTDEAFHQAENTVNLDLQGNPIPIYQEWESRGIPLVERKTLPTEGLIENVDQQYFNLEHASVDR